MSIIHVLDKEIAQLIAAGEVVERPSSIVKELVENAIDAKSTLVTIEIQNGGVTYIRVTDNGCGIAPEDVPKVFLRHATSKVFDENDLNSIATLGFRGEAMASIHAVCRVEMLTKTPGALEGVRYFAQGEIDENQEKISPAGCPVGTTIIARDIFFNTPARMKFLKKDNAEANSVAAVVEKTALSHPEISFKFIRDGKIKLHTPGDGKLISAIYAVESQEFAQGLIPVDYSNEGIRLTGYITKPDAVRTNRTMQNFFVNGRFVKSRTAAAALEEAYKNSIMIGKFPACVLNLEIPFTQTDVNVHPAKIEVRFVNEKPVFDAFYYGVKTALSTCEPILTPLPKGSDSTKKPITLLDLPRSPETKQLKLAPLPKQIHSQNQMNSSHMTAEEYRNLSDINKINANNFNNTNNLKSKNNVLEPANKLNKNSKSALENLPQQEVLEEEAALQLEEEALQLEEKVILENNNSQKSESEIIYIGEIFATYLVLQSSDAMILVDKHAAHERLIFDNLKAMSLTGDRQVLLEPIVVALSREDYQGVIDKIDAFCQIGFLAEDFGDGDLLVREVPVLLAEGDIKEIIEQAAHNLALQKHDLTPQEQEELLHSVACKSAIRAGDKNNSIELKELVRILQENPDVRTCPHGRPIAKSFSKYEFEKMFGRV